MERTSSRPKDDSNDTENMTTSNYDDDDDASCTTNQYPHGGMARKGQIVIPYGIVPGMLFTILANGRYFPMSCPNHVQPNSKLTIIIGTTSSSSSSTRDSHQTTTTTTCTNESTQQLCYFMDDEMSRYSSSSSRRMEYVPVAKSAIITIPTDAIPGEKFSVTIDGQLFTDITCPIDAKPGVKRDVILGMIPPSSSSSSSLSQEQLATNARTIPPHNTVLYFLDSTPVFAIARRQLSDGVSSSSVLPSYPSRTLLPFEPDKDHFPQDQSSQYHGGESASSPSSSSSSNYSNDDVKMTVQEDHTGNDPTTNSTDIESTYSSRKDDGCNTHHDNVVEDDDYHEDPTVQWESSTTNGTVPPALGGAPVVDSPRSYDIDNLPEATVLDDTRRSCCGTLLFILLVLSGIYFLYFFFIRPIYAWLTSSYYDELYRRWVPKSIIIQKIQQFKFQVHGRIDKLVLYGSRNYKFDWDTMKQDRDIALALVGRNGGYLQYLPQFIQDEEIVMTAIRSNPRCLQCVSDRRLVLPAVQNDGLRLSYCSQEHTMDKEIVLAAVQQNRKALRFVPEAMLKTSDFLLSLVENMGESITTNRECMLRLVRWNGEALQYGSRKVQDYLIIVEAAIRKFPMALQFASERIKANHYIVQSAVQKNGNALEYASVELRADAATVTMAVQNCTSALQFASEELKDDKDFVQAAVQFNGNALQFVSPGMKADRDVVRSAVKNTGMTLQYASSKLRDDKEIVLAAVGECPSAVEFASDEMKNDIQIWMVAARKEPTIINSSPAKFLAALIEVNPRLLKHAPDAIKGNKNAVLDAITKIPEMLQYASDDIKDMKDVVLVAVSANGSTLQYASHRLRNDKEVVITAVQRNELALKYASDGMKDDDELVLGAVRKRGGLLSIASNRLKGDKEIVLAAIRNNGLSIQHASEKLRASKDVVLEAIRKKPEAIKYALAGLNQDPDCLIEAKLWSTDHRINKMNLSSISRIALSTRFSLSKESQSSTNRFTVLLNTTPYFRDGNFVIYSPNAFSKDSCDPDWTNIDWPCRGTTETCRKDVPFKVGIPNDCSCWRYSYRYHLMEAKRTNGFMIQIADWDNRSKKYILGNGQRIETMMAHQVGTKIFRVCQPVNAVAGRCNFTNEHMEEFVKLVDRWYKDDCKDKSAYQVQFRNEQFGSAWKTFTHRIAVDEMHK